MTAGSRIRSRNTKIVVMLVEVRSLNPNSGADGALQPHAVQAGNQMTLQSWLHMRKPLMLVAVACRCWLDPSRVNKLPLSKNCLVSHQSSGVLRVFDIS